MAALAADANASIVGVPTIITFKANAADTYFKGSIVYADTAGGCQVTAAAGDRVLGISPKKQVVALGDEVAVLVEGWVWLPVGTNIAAEDENDVLVNDGPTDTDNPADMVSHDDITLAANDAAVGVIKRVTSTQMLVRIGEMTGRIAVAQAIDTTDSTLWR